MWRDSTHTFYMDYINLAPKDQINPRSHTSMTNFGNSGRSNFVADDNLRPLKSGSVKKPKLCSFSSGGSFAIVLKINLLAKFSSTTAPASYATNCMFGVLFVQTLDSSVPSCDLPNNVISSFVLRTWTPELIDHPAQAETHYWTFQLQEIEELCPTIPEERRWHALPRSSGSEGRMDSFLSTDGRRHSPLQGRTACTMD